MRNRHPFLDGRRVAAIIPLAIGTDALAYVFWYGSIDRGSCGIGIVELLAFSFALISSWLLNPAMATWEATGTNALRQLTSLANLVVIAIAAVTPIVIYFAVTRLSPSVVPKSEHYDFGRIGIAAWLPAVTNVLALASIAAVAIALTGRLAGTVAALAAYPALFWLGTSTSIPSPYTAFCSTDTHPPAWIAAAVIAVVATTILTTTGGTTTLSRRLDPRHSG